MPAMPPRIHKIATVHVKFRIRSCWAVFIVASASCAAFEDPPVDLVKRVAAREAATQAARSHYMYKQTVRVEDFHPNGGKAGEYGEIREVIFLADGNRSEHEVKKPWNRLVR